MTSESDMGAAAMIAAHIELNRGMDRLRQVTPEFAAADADTISAILSEAAKFSSTYLAPLNPIADQEACRLEDGRVRTVAGHRDAWKAFVDGGWPTLDQSADFGGQNLPLVLWAGCQELFDRGCVAFGMLPGPLRAAAHLVAAWGDEATKSEWLPKLVTGEWGATICISEADAGSDVGRLRTNAAVDDTGIWRITGEKMWISFGDHDLTPRIGHFLLARETGPTGGISLFLVPDTITSPVGETSRNAIVVRRIEEKMGLHGSPTCALGFEGAQAFLVGQPGRGLAQLFVMITNMRLSVGVQGLGLASLAADIGAAYAEERRQGGSPKSAAVPIVQHRDIQRLLLGMEARVEMLRGLILTAAIQADLATHESDPDAAARARALTQWLLPIVKTTGGEFAFDNASDAIQVLGGAGYTREWPVEQILRDARVFTVYEGTTGMQAIDLLHRRLWKDEGAGLRLFLQDARLCAARCAAPDHVSALQCFDLLEDAARHLAALASSPQDAEASATAFLHLASICALTWIAVQLADIDGSPLHARLGILGRYWLKTAIAHAELAHSQVREGAALLTEFDALRSTRSM